MRLASLFQVVGAIIITCGLWMLAPWIGVFGLGVMTTLAGIVLEMEGRDNGSVEPGKS